MQAVDRRSRRGRYAGYSRHVTDIAFLGEDISFVRSFDFGGEELLQRRLVLRLGRGP